MNMLKPEQDIIKKRWIGKQLGTLTLLTEP